MAARLRLTARLAAIRKCIEGGDIALGKVKTKVQDAYSMRSTPQVIGAAHDAIAYARSQVEIELNQFYVNNALSPSQYGGHGACLSIILALVISFPAESTPTMTNEGVPSSFFP